MFLKNTKFLQQWGWNEFFEQQLNEDDDKLVIGRVIGEEKDRWRVQIDENTHVWAELPGRYRHQVLSRMDLPSVGDWIHCKYEEHQAVALVEKVLQRKTCLYRGAVGGGQEAQILASNIDTAFVVTSANLDLNIARLERYISLVWSSGAQPVILITKSELAEDIDRIVEDLQTEFVAVDVLAVSVATRTNLQALEKYLQPGKSAVFIGSSGVGKSTLTNYLLGEDVLATKEIREDDHRGKHTTTARYLFPLSNGSFVIDTPGMRELSLLDQEEGVAAQFADCAALEEQCRFSDCEHRTEPGCAVLAAFESGELDEDRWKRYQKLQRELRRKTVSEDPVQARLDREKLKKRQKQMYEHIKMKRR